MIMIVCFSVAIQSFTATITTITMASAMTVSVTIIFNITTTITTAFKVCLHIFLLLRL